MDLGASATRRLSMGLMLGVAMHAFHGTAVVTALPVIAAALDGRDRYGAVLSVYLLASIVGLAAAARPIERHGPLAALRAGSAIFAAGILLSAAAPDMHWLVAARALEGLGGGVISNVIYASVNLAWPAGRRAQVLALLSAAWVIPTLIAPPFAAAIALQLGWRWVFLALLPVVGIALAFASGPLSALSPAATRAAHAGEDAGIGMRGALGLACGSALALAGADPWRWPAWTLPLALAAVVGGLLLAHRSLRAVLPAGTLALRRGLPAAIALKLLLAASFFGIESFLPLATTELLGWSIFEAGLLLSAAGICWTLGSFAEAHFGGRAEGRGATLGSVALVAGLALELLAIGAETSRSWIVLCWMLASFGMGVGYNVANSTAMAKTAPGREAATSSALGIADAFGIAFGSGLGGALLAASERAALPLATSLPLQLWLMVALGAAAVVVAGRLTQRPEAGAHDSSQPLGDARPADDAGRPQAATSSL